MPDLIKMKKARKRNESLFCFLMVGVFILHWTLFWVVGNINSIRLAFTYYSYSTDSHVIYPLSELFTNFSKFFSDIFNQKAQGTYILNGMFFEFLNSFICFPMGYFVSFIIYKKLKGSEFFKVMLYLPVILSGLLTGLLYMHFIESGISGLARDYLNVNFPYVFSDLRYNRLIVSIYVLYFGFPSGLLINLGTMSRIPHDLVEYGELEGISLFKEFCCITLPLVYPILEVQCMGIFVSLFLSQGPLYVFYSGAAPENLQTYGYYLFTSVYGGRDGASPQYMYGYTSAANLMIGILSVPVVQGTKWLLDKLDPGAEF